MISDRRKRGNRPVMRRRSGTCCVSCRNRIRGWILVKRRLGKWKGEKGGRGGGKGRGKGKRGKGGEENEEVIIAVTTIKGS